MQREFVLLYQKENDTILIQSPCVGFVANLPFPGDILIPESQVGNVQILSSQYALKLPKGVCGKVGDYDTNMKVKPVGYQEILFPLLPLDQIKSDIFSTTAEERKVEGEYTIFAPSDGIFYRRPSPDSPNYVEKGNIVKKGQVLGLVEVMKCFNQIAFQGSGIPDQAKLVEIYVQDACEVKYQQPLFVFSLVE
ncbi:MAG: hypothetical protein HUU50_19015 [Candidatus Brocadiae bacterium]|nr:hypothetical protein [Candidatus Brocadiia bacterium]